MPLPVEKGTDSTVSKLVVGSHVFADVTYGGSKSFQVGAIDLTITAEAGKDVADGTAYLAPVMGNVHGDALLETGNYVAGVIGAFSITGAKATHYPAGAVLAQITDGVTEADGAVVAYIDGDSAQTNAGAAFKVKTNNSTAASGFDFGLDLQDAAHDGYQAVNRAFYKKAQIRLTEDAVVFTNAGAPVNGTTLDEVAGTGSMCIDTTNGVLYINTGTKSSSTWVKVGTQA